MLLSKENPKSAESVESKLGYHYSALANSISMQLRRGDISNDTLLNAFYHHCINVVSIRP